VAVWFAMVAAPCGMAVTSVTVDDLHGSPQLLHEDCLNPPPPSDANAVLSDCCDPTLALKSDDVKVPKADSLSGTACFLEFAALAESVRNSGLSIQVASPGASPPVYLATLRLRL